MLDFNLICQIGFMLSDKSLVTIYDSTDYNNHLSGKEIMEQYDLNRHELFRLLISAQRLESYLDTLITQLKAIAIEKINNGEVIGNQEVGLYELKVVSKTNVGFKDSEAYNDLSEKLKDLKEIITFASKKGHAILNESTGEYIQPCPISNTNYIQIREVKK